PVRAAVLFAELGAGPGERRQPAIPEVERSDGRLQRDARRRHARGGHGAHSAERRRLTDPKNQGRWPLSTSCTRRELTEDVSRPRERREREAVVRTPTIDEIEI